MKSKRVQRMLGLSLGGLVLSIGGVSLASAQSSETIVIVVSNDVKVDEISVSTLRRVFLSEPTETGAGGRFTPLNQQPGTPIRETFDQRVLKLEPDEVAKFWVDQRIRGKGKPPRAIPNAKLLVRLVPKLPGAIAYVRASEVGPGLKVLKVDGKNPGESGYPL